MNYDDIFLLKHQELSKYTVEINSTELTLNKSNTNGYNMYNCLPYIEIFQLYTGNSTKNNKTDDFSFPDIFFFC